MKKLGTVTLNIIYTAVVLVILSLALLFVGTRVDLLGYEVKVVKSGSMEPTIMTGGIVVIKPEPVYNSGDVVTFGKDTKTQIPVTHRIIEKTGEGNSAVYRTKGDANEDVDPTTIKTKDIIGKVAFTIPYVGHAIEFARTPLGFFTLIGIPALLIILDEFANIVWEVRVYIAKQRRARELDRKRRLEAREAKKEEMVLDLRQFRDRVSNQKRFI